MTDRQLSDRIIAAYKEHYHFPNEPQGESHMRDCIMDALQSRLAGPLDSDKRDAERYRWLRDVGADTIYMKNEVSFWSGGALIYVKQIGWTELDKAIDAASNVSAATTESKS